MAGRKRAAGIAAAVGIAAGGGALTAGGPGAAAAPSVAHGKAVSPRGGSGSTTNGSRRSGWVDRLATRLGVSVATLRSALQDVREATPNADRHADLVSALAIGLGRSPAQVRTALEGGRTQRPRGRDALCVAQVRAILDAFRAEEAARRAARRDAFAASLAHELGMPAQQVSEALSAMPARRGHHR